MLRLRQTPVTILLLTGIAVGFVLETLAGGSTSQQVLVALGANVPPLVWQGEWWRLVASLFLHIGFLHLFVNAFSLYQIGSLFETWLGSARLLAVYFVCGVAASLTSVFFTRGLSAGASGAIFGLIGALIAFLLRRRGMLSSGGRSILGQLVMWSVINVVIGFTVPGIDNAAHLGGCATGMLFGLILRPPRERIAERTA
jgi:rhomboid protease GluP